MQVPLKWLRDYVDIDMDVNELADLLTMTGTKVEGISKVGAELKDIVAGYVIDTYKHPNSNKLSVVELDLGTKKSVVLTAATNVRKGDTVPVVLPGGVILGGTEIGTACMGGMNSEGMLCSSKELGIAPDADGILILPEGFEPGDDLIQKLGLKDDVIEFEITPNRPDCLCVIGIAREIAAITKSPFKMPDLSFEEIGEVISDKAQVRILDEDLCIRYGARMFKDVTVKESPLWMQIRLYQSGVRPINNVVDITNYVMLECNQPLHAFDYDLIAGHRITARRAKEGEKMVTLDGVERTMNEEMLLICDDERAVAVAGVMGGLDTEITNDTKTVLLESANFSGPSVWKTSRTLKLRSESSARFEKGLDPQTVGLALDRCSNLICQLDAGKVLEGTIDEGKTSKDLTRIEARVANINSKLGTDLTREEVEECLGLLGFVVKGEKDLMDVTVPSFRDDVKEEIDLVEEVARIWGYNRIPSTIPPVTSLGGWGGIHRQETLTREFLTSCGAMEVLTYTLICPTDLDDLMVPNDSNLRDGIRVSNPMPEDHVMLRTTMLPSILKVIATNVSRKNNDVNVFEIGKTFEYTESLRNGDPMKKGQKPAVETKVLAGGVTGSCVEQSWHSKAVAFDFYDVKGMLEGLFSELGVDGVEFVKSSHYALHPGRTCDVVINKETVGYMGEIHPDVAENYGVPQRTYVYELDYEKLVLNCAKVVKYRPIPKYPAVQRDIAILVDKKISAQEVEKKISDVGGTLVESVGLFDVYEGAQVAAGMRSLAFSVTYRASDRTLTDEEVEKVHSKVVSSLEDTYKASLR